MRVSEKLARFAADLRCEAIAPEALTAAKAIILDTLAVAWAGTASPGCEPIHRIYAADGGRSSATVWGFGGALPSQSAALVNGMSAAALDFDSLHVPATAHAGIVVLPAVLALAEERRLSGRETLSAFLAGHEIVCRLGLSMPGHTGWFYTSMNGVFGAAAGSARALGLGTQVIEAALGIALAGSAGTQQANIERCLLKRMQSAFAARNGAAAALLAEAGATGPTVPFEGSFGLYSLYEKGDPAVLLNDLGQRFHTAETSFKVFPSCGCSHAATQAALDLKARMSDATPEALEDIEVRISPYMHRLVGAPFDPDPNPEVTAQFSVQYAVAASLLRGRFDLSDLRDDAVRDPIAGELARRVRIVVDEANTGRLAPASVAVRLASGETLSETCEDLPGSPAKPFSFAEIADKAKGCFSKGVAPLDSAAVDELVGRIGTLEDLPDMSKFFAGCCSVPQTSRRAA